MRAIAREVLFWYFYFVSFLPNSVIRFLLMLSTPFFQRESQREMIRTAQNFLDRNHPSIKWMRHLSHGVSLPCSRGIIINFFATWFLNRGKKRRTRATGTISPDFVSISPSMACNLNCRGCYASSYDRGPVISKDKFNDIVKQARDLGAIVICVTGGEPLLYPHLLDVLRDNRDMYFLIYTNGYRVDEPFARKISKLGNALVLLSIEGDEAMTDDRRGKGCNQRVMAAAKVLRRNRTIFGFTIMASSANSATIADEPFFQRLVDTGASIIWFSTYMPVGSNPELSLVPTPEQRVMLHNAISRARKKLPILFVDFENDARYVGGCTGAGRRFLHINNEGNIEVCNFAHFYQDNIHKVSLKEALNSNFFREVRERQPFSPCTFTPCLLDCNIDTLRDILKKCRPKCSHGNASFIVEDDALVEFSIHYRQEIQQLFELQSLNFSLEMVHHEDQSQLSCQSSEVDA